MYMAMSYRIYTFIQIVMPTPKSFALWRILQNVSRSFRRSSPTFHFWTRCLASCEVELGLTGLTSTSLVSCSWVRKGIGSSLSRLVRTTVNSRLRLTCEPSSPINAFSHILSIKFWWLGYPCYHVVIAKAMDYTSKGELLWKNQPNY